MTTTEHPAPEPMGRVYFVGAGPGDPELLTLKAQRLIAAADVIIYAGSLVNPDVLSHARPDAETHDSAGMKLEQQVALMREAVTAGQTVVRLHTGDPAIYGATMEQMQALDEADVPYAVVPGVSSAFAAAASLAIELTIPEETQTIIFTRLAGRTPVPEREALQRLAAHRSSLVIFLSVGMIARVVDELRAAGYDTETPVAVVYRASWPDERIVRGTLADVVDRVRQAEITRQALIIVSPALRPDAKRAAQRSHLYGAALDAPESDDATAIVTLTRGGTRTGEQLHARLPGSLLYAPERFVSSEPPDGVVAYAASVRQVLQSAFRRHSALIAVMAGGIVVRQLAPLLESKRTDPAVVVVDERGEHAISLLSGHQGGANRLARRVADALGGTPVLTTSSDVQGLPAVDLLGREDGWVIERDEHLTAVSAALVNGDPVGVVQEAGDASWWPDPTPENLARYATAAALREAAPAAALLITPRQVPDDVLDAVPHAVVYRPPCLAVGVGCNRDTPADELLDGIDRTLDDTGLAAASVCCVATIEDKADEDGIIEACEARGWPLRIFSREAVAQVEAVPNPSVWAERVLGVPGVAEPSALLAAETETLLVEKRKFRNVTVALALRSEEPE
jgi:precorrin-4 C11-methyltransferase